MNNVLVGSQYSTAQEGCHSLSACSPADEPG